MGGKGRREEGHYYVVTLRQKKRGFLEWGVGSSSGKRDEEDCTFSRKLWAIKNQESSLGDNRRKRKGGTPEKRTFGRGHRLLFGRKKQKRFA